MSICALCLIIMKKPGDIKEQKLLEKMVLTLGCTLQALNYLTEVVLDFESHTWYLFDNTTLTIAS